MSNPESDATWVLLREITPPPEANACLVAGETGIVAFATANDWVLFSSHRLVLRQVRGLRGKKVRTTSVPWTAVAGWSTATGKNRLDGAHIELTTHGGPLFLEIGNAVDPVAVDRLVADRVLRLR